MKGDTQGHGRTVVSSRIDVAVALGIWRPAVLLPAKWANESPLPLREGLGEGSDASHSVLHTVLAHELAHIENRDLHWLAATRALLTLLWAQPLYWLLRRRLRLDQEVLADAAAAEMTSRQNYAEQLVAWARDIYRPGLRCASHRPSVCGKAPRNFASALRYWSTQRFTVLRNCSRVWKLATVAICGAPALGGIVARNACTGTATGFECERK